MRIWSGLFHLRLSDLPHTSFLPSSPDPGGRTTRSVSGQPGQSIAVPVAALIVMLATAAPGSPASPQSKKCEHADDPPRKGPRGIGGWSFRGREMGGTELGTGGEWAGVPSPRSWRGAVISRCA